MLSEQARRKADEAKEKGLWLYDPSYKKWYTPEDFQHIFTYAKASDDFLKGVQLRHPSEGIDAGFKRLSDIQDKLEQFAKRVVEYYNR